MAAAASSSSLTLSLGLGKGGSRSIINFFRPNSSLNHPTTTPFILQKIKLHPNNNINNNITTSRSSSIITRCMTTISDSSQRSTNQPAQQLYIFEFNERDRGSPVYLRLGNKSANSLGDIVTFTNKIYSGDLTKRLGISAGILLVMNVPGKTNPGDHYEATISFYFGDYGHISCQGAYKSNQDTFMAVTGGTGIFQGVYGQVKVHNLLYPLKLNYVFTLKGIPDLPAELTQPPVDPKPDVQPTPEAKATAPNGVISNFTE